MCEKDPPGRRYRHAGQSRGNDTTVPGFGGPSLSSRTPRRALEKTRSIRVSLPTDILPSTTSVASNRSAVSQRASRKPPDTTFPLSPLPPSFYGSGQVSTDPGICRHSGAPFAVSFDSHLPKGEVLMDPSRFVRTDRHWLAIAPLRPGGMTSPGRTGQNTRLFLEAVLWPLRTDAARRSLPPEFANWNSIFGRFRRDSVSR